MSHSKDLLYPKARQDFLDLVEREGFEKSKTIWADCMLHHTDPALWARRFAYSEPARATDPVRQPGNHTLDRYAAQGQDQDQDQEVIA